MPLFLFLVNLLWFEVPVLFLNRRGQSEHTCLVPDLRGKLSVFHQCVWFLRGVFSFVFYYVEVVLLFLVYCFFFMKECWISLNFFCISLGDHVGFSFILLMWCIMLDQFSHVEPFLRYTAERINVTWSLYNPDNTLLHSLC